MVDSLKKPEFQEIRPGVKAPAKDTILTPRFYTTDFDEMANMDISVNEDELQAILEEFRADYNRHHFVRDEEFEQSWEHIDGDTPPSVRRIFRAVLHRRIFWLPAL
jgi:magnesium-protoporphyrin IX monomethyl ester (oxidative) cyclase